MLQKVDRDGSVIKEKKNESGKKIGKSKKPRDEEEIYKRWTERTHLSL